MPLPSSGTIAISQISVELGRASTATTSLGETASRNLAGVPSGTISMSNFYGKSNTFAFTISSNQDRANLRSLAVAAGWNQSSNVQATLAGGVWIYSSTTATPALTIDGSWPGGVTLINNGNIVGMGGNGGNGGVVLTVGGGGGTGIACSVPVTIQNNSNIAGGGGGGGGGGVAFVYTVNVAGGGGGGGGQSGLANSAGGPGGTATTPGGPGGAGTSGGAGGGGAGGVNSTYTGGAGASGGGWGSAGNTGGTSSAGGLGAAGGAAGFCTTGSGNITWSANGNRFGPFG
jgi:hypothetical protein